VAIQEATRVEEDDEAYWAAVDRLRKQGVGEVWRLVTPLAQDERPAIRALVPDTLRYFKPHSLREETVSLLAQMLDTEDAPLVLGAIGGGLAARLADEDAEIRTEAILALATRRDERALEPLKRELQCWRRASGARLGREWDQCVEAAEHFGSSELLPLLKALLQQYPEEEPALAAALEACESTG